MGGSVIVCVDGCKQRLFNLNETVLCNERTLSLAQIGNSFKMILKCFMFVHIVDGWIIYRTKYHTFH